MEREVETVPSSALINKYRPKTLDEVIGQDAIVKSLRLAIKNKSSHGFLFTGPSGTGKTTLSYIAAGLLGCREADITDVDAATYTGIDDMRGLTAGMLYRPLGVGSAKAMIVDEAHALSKQAWQSLLKSLEKPPPWVYWFLCTTEPSKVPISVNTRCLRYELKPVANKVLGELYDQVIAAEKLDVPGDIGDLLIKEAHGSPRQLLSNIGVCASAESRKEAAALLMTASEEPAAIDLARALYKGNRDWMELKPLIFALRGRSAESVRHVVRAYGEKIVESGKSEDQDGPHMEVLSAFRQPFNDGNGLTDLLDTVASISTLSG